MTYAMTPDPGYTRRTSSALDPGIHLTGTEPDGDNRAGGPATWNSARKLLKRKAINVDYDTQRIRESSCRRIS